MNIPKTWVILLALLLAAMAMVPIVSASEEQSLQTDSLTQSNDIIEKNYVSEKTAFQHASIMMMDYVKTGLDEGHWNGAVISPDPVIIYDMNGERLFYRFYVIKNSEAIGEITIAASKVLKISLQEINEGVTLNPEIIQSHADDLVKAEFPGYRITSMEYVCYDYPSIGVKIQIFNEKTGDREEMMFDAATFSQVTPENIDGKMIMGGWSYYKSIPVAKYSENSVSWNENQIYVLNLEKDFASAGISADKPLDQKSIAAQKSATISPMATGEANYIMYFPTTSQQYSKWCMIATAWLMTKFYHPTTQRTQENIAATMGVGTNQGASASAEIDYYQAAYISDSSASGGLGKGQSISSWYLYPSVPLTYDMIKAEINAETPIKTGVNYVDNGQIFSHARACIGYWQYTDGRRLYKYSDPGTNTLRWLAEPGASGSIDVTFIDYIKIRPQTNA